MFAAISQAEVLFIEQGCQLGVREDGRDIHDLRHIFIENNVLPHSNGSARVKVADAIDILCSVKVNVMDTSAKDDIGGSIEVSTDISPICNITADDRKLASKAGQISEILEKFYQNSQCIDFAKLCIVSGKSAWMIYVDLIIFQCDGDPIEACSLAIYSALSCTRIPKIETIRGESGRDEDYEISGDVADSFPLPFVYLPIAITISKIGDVLVLDCAGKEVACASSTLAIAMDREGKCYGMTKTGGGSMTVNDIKDSLALAKAAAKIQLDAVQAFFSSSNPVFQKDFLYPEVPVTRIGFLA